MSVLPAPNLLAGEGEAVRPFPNLVAGEAGARFVSETPA